MMKCVATAALVHIIGQKWPETDTKLPPDVELGRRLAGLTTPLLNCNVTRAGRGRDPRHPAAAAARRLHAECQLSSTDNSAACSILVCLVVFTEFPS